MILLRSIDMKMVIGIVVSWVVAIALFCLIFLVATAAATICKNVWSAFSTGSRVYGFPSDRSDYDVCISYVDEADATSIVSSLGGTDTEQSSYNDGTKHTFGDGSVINLIPLHHMDLLYWALATVEMGVMKPAGYYV